MNRQDLIDEVTEGILSRFTLDKIKQHGRDLYNRATQTRDRTIFNSDDKEELGIDTDELESLEDTSEEALQFLTLDLKYDKFKNNLIAAVNSEVSKALRNSVNSGRASKLVRPQPLEGGRVTSLQVYSDVADLVLKRLDSAIDKALPDRPQDLFKIKESLNKLRPVLMKIAKQEHKKMLKENKNSKLKVRING